MTFCCFSAHTSKNNQWQTSLPLTLTQLDLSQSVLWFVQTKQLPIFMYDLPTPTKQAPVEWNCRESKKHLPVQRGGLGGLSWVRVWYIFFFPSIYLPKPAFLQIWGFNLLFLCLSCLAFPFPKGQSQGMRFIDLKTSPKTRLGYGHGRTGLGREPNLVREMLVSVYGQSSPPSNARLTGIKWKKNYGGRLFQTTQSHYL